MSQINHLMSQLNHGLGKLPPSTTRNLWLLIAGLTCFHNLWVIYATQNASTLLVFTLLCWWGALTCMEDRLDELQPKPSTTSLILGSGLLLWCYLRSSLILDRDGVIYLLALLEVVGLALLCTSMRRITDFWQQITIIALVPATLVGQKIYPEEVLSLLTAKAAAIWLTVFGFDVSSSGRIVTISDFASVSVLGACNGYDQVAQVVAIALIFLLAFPLRRKINQAIIFIAAPTIAIITNTFRIALLNVLVYLDALNENTNQWWFDFFHDGDGSLIFSGIAVCMFAWLYLKVLDKELTVSTSSDL